MQIYRCYTHLASSCCFHLAENAAQIVRTFLHIGNSHQSKNMDEICQSGVTPLSGSPSFPLLYINILCELTHGTYVPLVS